MFFYSDPLRYYIPTVDLETFRRAEEGQKTVISATKRMVCFCCWETIVMVLLTQLPVINRRHGARETMEVI